MIESADGARSAAPRDPSATIFRPNLQASERGGSRAGWTLSPQLRDQITRRLRAIAITFSLAFFFADVIPTTVFNEWGERASRPAYWVPTVCSIFAGVIVAILASTSRLSWRAKVNLGLVFEVAGSYGIALSQYILDPTIRSEPHILHVLSPSWVAIWMMFYSIIVPAPPRKTLLALIGSASAPLVVLWTSVHAAKLGDLMPLPLFLVHHVLPYAICVGMAYFGARVIYTLGTEASRAHELGSYRLTARLGRGGMGEVWRASHQLLARPAAIKFIRTETIAGVSPAEARLLLKRFELEARATASLTSAHTIDLYDYGACDDGSFYYVMELLDGLDCEELVRRHGAIPPARVVYLLDQVCESLEEAHEQGLIHRDVKPANIYVCRNGIRYDFIKVLDFGLVTNVRSAEGQDTRLTRPNQAVGTPQFMPPEVALGRPIDARTDLYAVGCVAYWLATGRPVFGGDTLFDVVSKHLNVAPEPPSLHAMIPKELEAVILACLEKDPDRRPATARELGRRLRAVPLPQRWTDEQAEAWWREAGLVAPQDRAVHPEWAETIERSL